MGSSAVQAFEAALSSCKAVAMPTAAALAAAPSVAATAAAAANPHAAVRTAGVVFARGGVSEAACDAAGGRGAELGKLGLLAMVEAEARVVLLVQSGEAPIRDGLALRRWVDGWEGRASATWVQPGMRSRQPLRCIAHKPHMLAK